MKEIEVLVVIDNDEAAAALGELDQEMENIEEAEGDLEIARGYTGDHPTLVGYGVIDALPEYSRRSKGYITKFLEDGHSDHCSIGGNNEYNPSDGVFRVSKHRLSAILDAVDMNERYKNLKRYTKLLCHFIDIAREKREMLAYAEQKVSVICRISHEIDGLDSKKGINSLQEAISVISADGKCFWLIAEVRCFPAAYKARQGWDQPMTMLTLMNDRLNPHLCKLMDEIEEAETRIANIAWNIQILGTERIGSYPAHLCGNTGEFNIDDITEENVYVTSVVVKEKASKG